MTTPTNEDGPLDLDPINAPHPYEVYPTALDTTPMPKGSFVSPDGSEWVRIGGSVRLAVEAVVASGKMDGSTSLASLAANTADGWWKTAAAPTGGHDTDTSGQEVATATVADPLRVIPNPFNPRTEIAFYLETPSRASIELLDVRGRSVRRLLDSHLGSGPHYLAWDGRDDHARPVASGVYFVRLVTDDGIHVRRAVLLR